jgi:hypothetical protein
MDIERLGLSDAQRASIDEEFLTTTLNMLNQADSFQAMGYRTSGELGDELELICARTFDAAHVAIATGERNIPPVITRSLARLSFIDALALPSSKPAAKDAPDSQCARGGWGHKQRLFVDMPNAD